MLRSSITGFAGLLVVAALSSGCLGGGDTAIDETEATADELSVRGWEPLVGAWVGTSGPFEGLVITRTPEGQGRHFFADVDTGIRCITTPCPSQAHLEGRVTAGTRNLTFRHPDRPSHESAPFYGTPYAYTVSGSTLTLAQNGRVVARLRKATSYCSEAEQCAEQNLTIPYRCVGRFDCESNVCRYHCGQRPVPTCATTLCAPGTICVQDDEGPRCITACAAVRCASGTTCVADARGARCVPRTCANTTCAAGEMCTDGGSSGPSCISRCAAVRCTAGTTCVADAAGVRCQPDAGVRCGTTTCGAGLVCCNPLRNICTAPGMFCIQ